MSRYYLTTPIYYVNDRPHIGHAYTTVAADALARYRRSLGDEVFFLTGVDEHGQKVEKAARARGIEPQAHCDEMAPRFQALWQALGVRPDAFLRTTDPAHKRYVQDALQKLHDEGLIEARDFSGWYCTPCERFWTEKDLREGSCPDCSRGVELIQEKNYFFLMSRYAGRIRAALEDGSLSVLPVHRRNEVLGFLDRGLEDLCISRPRRRLGWGIPLPFDAEYVTYVWFDALLNYVSGPSYLAPGRPRVDVGGEGPGVAGKEQAGGSWWPADVHLLGKDILTTHAVYWPAMLMALGLPLPRRLVAHGWWTMGGEKMSKSVGNVVDPLDVLERYAPEAGDRAAREALRWFLLAEVAFGQDGTFSLEAFERRWTSDLANDIGNLASRVVSLAHRVCGGTITLEHDASDDEAIGAYAAAMESCAFARAADTAVRVARSLNALLQERRPWEKPPDAARVLGRAAAGLRAIAWMMYPFCPESAVTLAAALGTGDPAIRPAAGASGVIAVGTLAPLFARPVAAGGSIGDEGAKRAGSVRQKSKEKVMTETTKAPGVTTGPPQATGGETPRAASGAGTPGSPDGAKAAYAGIDDLQRLGLRVAVVTAAERVPKTDRLLKLTVDLGTETRTIVAGIAAVYAPEQMVGQRVVIVANLQPATIRGIESRGMVLCAADGTGLSLVAPLREMPAGCEVR